MLRLAPSRGPSNPWLLGMALLIGVGLGVGFLLQQPQPLPDFSQWRAGEARKQRFFDYLRPLLEAANAEVRADRQRLESLAAERNAAGGDWQPGWWQRHWLRQLARRYELDGQEVSATALVQELLLRVDVVPLSLGLAQAAKESGWGTSRFAIDGYNLFGQRCFSRGCGMVPRRRRPGLRHEVQRFDSAAESVRGYLHNLNTHPDYEALRRARAALRAAGKPLTGTALAEHLVSYSERREDYIAEIRQMIRYNGLGALDGSS